MAHDKEPTISDVSNSNKKELLTRCKNAKST